MEIQPLADRLKKLPLPLDLLLRYGAQIARAPDAAHRRGIVHRDLEPASAMLTASAEWLRSMAPGSRLHPGSRFGPALPRRVE